MTKDAEEGGRGEERPEEKDMIDPLPWTDSFLPIDEVSRCLDA